MARAVQAATFSRIEEATISTRRVTTAWDAIDRAFESARTTCALEMPFTHLPGPEPSFYFELFSCGAISITFSFRGPSFSIRCTVAVTELVESVASGPSSFNW